MNPAGKTIDTLNATFVRPVKFYLKGFSDISHVEFYYAIFCFVYIMTVLGNGFLLFVIYFAKTLHTPKYMIVFNLALTDLCGSTALIPKLLDIFLFNRRYIVYEACLSYMFFVSCFAGLQSWTLVIMAFDRFIAICLPLRYHTIVNKKNVLAMLLLSWMFLLSLMMSIVGLIDRLSFCGSLIVESFFCDHGAVYRLSCNDRSLNFIMAFVALIVVICIPPVLIALTYVCIFIAFGRMATRAERFRAMKTCTSHLILVGIFFLPLLATNISVLAFQLHPNVRMINSSLTYVVPSLLNPIVYSLKTEEVLNTIKNIVKRNRLNNRASKNIKQ